MPKGERRRRRKADPQAEGLSTQGDELPPEAAPSDQIDTAAQDPQPDGATPAAEGHGWPDGTPPRPIALAEILVNPDLVGRNDYSGDSTGTPSANTAAGTAPDPDEPPPWKSPPPAHVIAASGERERPDTETTFAHSPPPPYRSEDLSLAAPDDRQRWTREPMLVALLMAALLVLIFDTYFTWRLNGLSDRLASMTSAAGTSAAERPWVGVDSIKTAPFANGGQPVTTVHIINSGHEPAYDLRSNTAGSLRSAATAGPAVPTQKGQLAVTALLLPNVGGNLTFFGNTRALTAEEAANVRSGQYVLWLAGRLDYKDAHGHPHLTTFRYRYNPALSSFMATPDGNSAN